MAFVEWHLFASPNFLSQINVSISSPSDLIGIKSLGFGWQSTDKEWTLTHRHEPSVKIAYKPNFCSDDMWALKRGAEKGGGITALPHYVCIDEVANGTLIRVLPEWVTASTQLSILTPSRKGMSAVTSALLKHLCETAQSFIGAKN